MHARQVQIARQVQGRQKCFLMVAGERLESDSCGGREVEFKWGRQFKMGKKVEEWKQLSPVIEGAGSPPRA